MKDRQRIIRDDLHEELRAYFGGILRELNSPVLTAGVVSDHVHLLYRHSKNLALANVVEEVKKSSSKWIKTKDTAYAAFHWQSGYGAFSVSASKCDAVQEYVMKQEEHHKRMTFQEEFRRFLKEYGVKYDEQYVWD